MKIVEYQESFGNIEWQGGFDKELSGKSLEDQLRCFAFIRYEGLIKIPYQELEAEVRKESWRLDGIEPIPDYWYAIVKDDTIAGFAYNKYVFNEQRKDWDTVGPIPLMPYQGYVYGSDSDNNGSGYKEREWYKYLVCLPYGHTLW